MPGTLRTLLALLALAHAGDLIAQVLRFGAVTEEEQQPRTSVYVKGLESAKPLRAEETRKVIVENFEKSYITVRSGVHLGGDDTRSDMMYEGQIFANLSWITPPKCPILTCWVDVPIRIQVRQLTSESKPVRTPSYNPGLRMYIWDSDAVDTRSTYYYSLGLHHYSNGQEGAAANPDGTANVVSGSFNTNYIELGMYRIGNAFLSQWLGLELRQHFIGTWEAFQRDQYEKGHVSVKARSRPFYFFGEPSQLALTGSYSYGRTLIVKNDVDPSRNVDATARDNLSATVEFNVKPKSWTDVAFYLRYDVGYDYYNINFQNRMNRIQFGVSSTNF